MKKEASELIPQKYKAFALNERLLWPITLQQLDNPEEMGKFLYTAYEAESWRKKQSEQPDTW